MKDLGFKRAQSREKKFPLISLIFSFLVIFQKLEAATIDKIDNQIMGLIINHN